MKEDLDINKIYFSKGQLKPIDTSRLSRKVGLIEKEGFNEIKKQVLKLIDS